LADSLNAPAARVLRLVGNGQALAVMAKAGLRLDPARDYGDSLVLGGAEVSLAELSAAYAVLARGGAFLAPVYETESPGALLQASASSQGDAASAAPYVLDPAAAWLVNQSLIDDGRLPPGLPKGRAAFKTGTSHGLRDAWLMAWTPDHTLGLWLGDPAGKGHEGLSGLAALGSAAVSVIEALGPGSSWPGPPPGLVRYRACPLSGEPVSPNCPGFVWAWRLERDARTITCRLHVREGGAVVIKWPPALAGFMASLAEPKAAASASGPKVVSPQDGAVFRLSPGADKIPLKAEGARGTVHWFIDDELAAISSPGSTPLITLTEGGHKVAMIDQSGRPAVGAYTVLKDPPRRALVLPARPSGP
jgi:penicillin-binding protein 1C